MRIVLLLFTAFLISCGNKEQKRKPSLIIKLSIKNFEKVQVELRDRFPDIKVLQSEIRLEPDSATLILERKILQPGFIDLGILNPAYKANWPVTLYADGSKDTIYIEADMQAYARKGLLPYPQVTTTSPLQNELALFMHLRDSMRVEYHQQKDSVKNLLVSAIERGNKQEIDTLAEQANNFDKQFKFFMLDAVKLFHKSVPSSVISVYAALEGKVARWEPERALEFYKNLPEAVRNSVYGQLLNSELKGI